MNFLEFVEKQKLYIEGKTILTEALRTTDVGKAHELITNLFKKNINGKVLYDTVPMDITSGGQKMIAYVWYLLKDETIDMMWTLNYSIDARTAAVYSVDFYDAAAFEKFVLTGKNVKTSVTIETMGTSIAYLIPVICHIINNHDFILSDKIVRDETSKVFKESKEFDYFIGKQNYTIFEFLKKDSIFNMFVLNTKSPDTTTKQINEMDKALQNYRWKLKNERDAAWAEERDKKARGEASRTWNEVNAEYAALLNAIRGGAQTIADINIALGKNIVTTSMPAIEKLESEEELLNPEQVFREMQHYAKMVVKGTQPSVIICGAPGVGKTYRIKQLLKANHYKEDVNMCTIKGKCTARKLYMALYDFKRKGDIVVIDDADAIVGPHAPEDCINILKAALDSSDDDEGRLVNYGIAGKLIDDEGDPLPKKFYYNGGVIVLTNYRAGQLDSALRGRSFIQDIDFSNAQILDIVKRLMPEIEPDKFSMKSKLKAFDYLTELNDTHAEMKLSLRTFVLCCKLYQSAENDPDFTEEDVRHMIASQMKMQAAKGGQKY